MTTGTLTEVSSRDDDVDNVATWGQMWNRW